MEDWPTATADTFRRPVTLAFVIAVLFLAWTWRTRTLACPRCRRRLRRVGRDHECAYYPCSTCRIMWRSRADRGRNAKRTTRGGGHVHSWLGVVPYVASPG
jgi:tRNA(Ile2) C34 agmatinyltransferase TiaS